MVGLDFGFTHFYTLSNGEWVENPRFFQKYQVQKKALRVLRRIVHAGANGKAYGRPKTAALKETEIKRMDKEGLNKSQIARELGISRTSVRRALNNI